MRLDKFLSDMTGEGRSQIKNMIKKGLARVNDTVCKDPGTKTDPDKDLITLEGRVITYRKYSYFMLNKPAGLLSATQDTSQQTVLDLFPPKLRKGLFPVGRLDKDTVGLLLITDDGQLAHHLTSPRHHVEKTYLLSAAAPLTAEDATAFKNGIELKDGTLLKDALLVIDEKDPCRALITIKEGKYHQIKRMIASRSNKVTYLKRISMGPLTLDESLKEGEYRALTPAEITSLLYKP